MPRYTVYFDPDFIIHGIKNVVIPTPQGDKEYTQAIIECKQSTLNALKAPGLKVVEIADSDGLNKWPKHLKRNDENGDQRPYHVWAGHDIPDEPFVPLPGEDDSLPEEGEEPVHRRRGLFNG